MRTNGSIQEIWRLWTGRILQITDRIKDMIIRGGECLSREIEGFLYPSDIKDVQVVGVPNRKYGEKSARLCR
ncbi:MAG: hypothetical protein R2941_11625 [Desulfobacterales bacterium]